MPAGGSSSWGLRLSSSLPHTLLSGTLGLSPSGARHHCRGTRAGVRGPAQTRLPRPRPWALGFRRLEGLVLVSPRCVDGDPNRKGRRRLGGACPPAAPRGWHRRLLPAGALGPQAHPGGRAELWLVESRVVGGWFSFLHVAVMLPCRLGGRVGRWGPNDHPPNCGDGLGGGRGRAGRGREGGSWARGSHCCHGSAVRGVCPGAGKHGTGVVCGRLHVVTAAGEHTGVEGCRQPRDARVVFRERPGGGDLGDGEPCPRGCVGVKRARETQPEWPGRGR